VGRCFGCLLPSCKGFDSLLRIHVVPSGVDSLWLLQPFHQSISMAEDRKDDGHQAPSQAGKIRSSGPLEIPASATLQMLSAPDTASLSGYVSWLELQYQQAGRQLATVATNVPAVHAHSANLPHHSNICSQYPLGREFLPHGTNTSQVYRSAPAAHSNTPPTNQAAGACQNWNGMSFPLPGSSVEYMGEMEGFVAGLGSTDTSLSSDYLAMLAQQSILEASGQFSGGEAIVRLMLMFSHPSWFGYLCSAQKMRTCICFLYTACLHLLKG